MKKYDSFTLRKSTFIREILTNKDRGDEFEGV